MPVRFLKNASELADVSWETPLPVQVANAKPVPADTLHIATTTVDTTANRDLLGSTSTELPTLDGCMQYRKLVWLAHRASNTAINYTIRARAIDLTGTPLGSGWQTIATGAFAADPANPNWVRLDIPAAGDGYYDQYRIEVSVDSGTVALTSKIVGVR
jgi:hypothetical protein